MGKRLNGTETYIQSTERECETRGMIDAPEEAMTSEADSSKDRDA